MFRICLRLSHLLPRTRPPAHIHCLPETNNQIFRAFTSTSIKYYSQPSQSTESNSMTVDTTERLGALRALMKTHSVGAYVVPSEDQHFSEYLAACDERRAFISGFNGSAGCAVVTTDEAYLFTDGRYFLQAEQQLDRNWNLMKQGLPNVPTWQEFLHKKLPKNTKIGMDPTLISAVDAADLTKNLSPNKSELVGIDENLIDIAWGHARHPRPANEIIPLPTQFSGQSHTEKLKALHDEMSKHKSGARALVLSALDEVAWAFNLRGSDIDYNPVFFAYAVLTPEKALLFVNPAQLSEEAREHLGKDVEIRPYGDFFAYLKGLGAELQLTAENPALISDKASLAVQSALGGPQTAQTVPSPAAALKALKNSTEIAGFRASHIRDGAALARYFAWLAETVQTRGVSECEGADVLEKYRSEGKEFRGLSFPTISGAGANGAIIHYQPEPATCATITNKEMYLCDSGAQYSDGTTDVTRTWHFSTPSEDERRAFTRVLQGHIAIDSAVFPEGTTGYVIDSWARRALWKDGLDYRHGTGHGVGHFLNVHEGPQGIGVRIAYNSTALKPGMTVSNEPGYYADGRFGIRIENVVAVREVETPNKFGGKKWYGFENFTMCPIQRTLVDKTLLAPDEVAWLDAYHQEVLEKVRPLLANDDRAMKWLEAECAPL